MGFFFSNVQVRRTEGTSVDALLPLLDARMKAQGFLPVDKAEDADLTISVYDAGGKWLSVCSDGVEFCTEETERDFCAPISEALSADVVTVSCFDSDCLLLHRVDRKSGIEAWAKVGRCPGVGQRSSPARWKGLVDDIPQWSAALKGDYGFAEDALEHLEPLLGLAPGQGRFCTELIEAGEYRNAKTYCYLLPADEKPEPPRLILPRFGLMPCEIGKPQFQSVYNVGGKSAGLAVVFSGNYVEHEEIWFRDVQLEYGFDRPTRQTIPLQLEKRQLPDSRWVYYAEVPQFRLPPAVKDGLPARKSMEEEFKRDFGLRFTPEGNERKRLDVTVRFIPLKNPAGQCSWCVWHCDGSKRAYIERYNRSWSGLRLSSPPAPLDENKLDMEE